MQGWNGHRPFDTTPPESSYAIAKSTDRGRSWKLTLAPAFMRSCRPRAVTLSRFGTVLVSGGRPPLALWATRDGESWTAYDIPSEHNRLVPPAQRFCPEYSRGVNDTFQQSSGYTSINVLSATSALVCYERQSDFHFPDCNKPPAQSTIFCMRVRDDGGKLTPGELATRYDFHPAACALTPMGLLSQGSCRCPRLPRQGRAQHQHRRRHRRQARRRRPSRRRRRLQRRRVRRPCPVERSRQSGACRQSLTDPRLK